MENATYYEVSVWRMSASNASLLLERRGSMGYGMSQALARGEGVPWLVKGPLGSLKIGDEAGASACNRYGCSPALLLRPTENLLHSASVPWWNCEYSFTSNTKLSLFIFISITNNFDKIYQCCCIKVITKIRMLNESYLINY